MARVIISQRVRPKAYMSALSVISPPSSSSASFGFHGSVPMYTAFGLDTKDREKRNVVNLTIITKIRRPVIGLWLYNGITFKHKAHVQSKIQKTAVSLNQIQNGGDPHCLMTGKHKKRLKD